MIHASAFIHPKAHVEESEVGARTRIWQFASVIRGTRLGEDCNVASCATLDGPYFGDRCIVSQGVAMGPGFKIGSDVFIGPNVTVCNDRWPAYSKTAFDADRLRDGFCAVIVGNYACIGANAVVLPGVTIGTGAVIGAGSVVSRDIPANYIFHSGRTVNLREIKPEWRTRRMREALCLP